MRPVGVRAAGRYPCPGKNHFWEPKWALKRGFWITFAMVVCDFTMVSQVSDWSFTIVVGVSSYHDLINILICKLDPEIVIFEIVMKWWDYAHQFWPIRLFSLCRQILFLSQYQSVLFDHDVVYQLPISLRCSVFEFTKIGDNVVIWDHNNDLWEHFLLSNGSGHQIKQPAN